MKCLTRGFNIETQKRRRKKNHHNIPFKMTTAADLFPKEHFQTLVGTSAMTNALSR